MDERTLREEELTNVTGGVGNGNFAGLTDDFARANGCALCSNRVSWRHNGVCWEEYHRLLSGWTNGDAVEMRCTRRT